MSLLAEFSLFEYSEKLHIERLLLRFIDSSGSRKCLILSSAHMCYSSILYDQILSDGILRVVLETFHILLESMWRDMNYLQRTYESRKLIS